MSSTGKRIYKLMQELFPICRSITGEGTRKTLFELKKIVPQMQIYEVPSGTQVFDWTVPKEWNIYEAYIENSKGEKIIDFKKNNLHVVNYSTPVDQYMSLNNLKKIIHTYPPLPNAIPYVTSYYNESFGFCMTQNQFDNLEEDTYHVYIDSSLKDGSLTYGEIIIPGDVKEEVFFSTYICHPSMANNELSGPCVSIYLAKKIMEMKHKYTYRFVYIPETIGAITYLSKNYKKMKENMIAGYNLSCLGDDITYTCVDTKYGNTLSDKVANCLLKDRFPNYNHYSFLKRGSDERQYNMPGIDLPVCGIYRSKSNEYAEYHTSLDNMEFVKNSALQDSYEFLLDVVSVIESNKVYVTKCLCEPQLGKRGLYPKTSTRGSSKSSGAFKMIDFLAYADGHNDLLDISCLIDLPVLKTKEIAEQLLENGLIH